MVNGLKVPSRLAVLNHRGTLERRKSGFVDWPSNGVGATRDRTESARGNPSAILLESTGEKSSVRSCKMSVPETDTGG